MRASRPLAVALALAFRSHAGATLDAAAFVQSSVVRHSGVPEEAEDAREAGRAFSLGQRGERHERTTLQVQADQSGSLGLTTKLWRGFGPTALSEEILQIEAIAWGGPIDMWNRLNPHQQVNVGDRILSINGHGGNARTIQKAIGAVQLVPVGEQPPTTILVVEPSQTPTGGHALKGVVDAALKIATKGPKEYLREAIPYDLGKVFINGQETVRKCGDITSPHLCDQSSEKFQLECAGWGGLACLAKEKVACESLATPALCASSQQKFGIECDGWGGSSCLSKGAPAHLITRESICNSAARLKLEVAGWGGDKCLDSSARCGEISAPGICNEAHGRLGIRCLGWGGSSCLAPGDGAELITSELLCKHAAKKFGIDAAGWGGSNCFSKEGLTCDKIMDPAACSHARERLGIECAGWGGSSCLPKGSPAALITSSSICARSELALGIPSGGWSGTSCLPAGAASCGAITRPGVCNDAASRLGIDCAGWSGERCFAPGEAKCTEVTGAAICKTSVVKFGLECVWSGDACFPG